MGSLIAVFDKKGGDASNTAVAMLETLSHRGSDAYGVASAERVVMSDQIEELKRANLGSNALIGHNYAKKMPRDEAQPSQYKHQALVFDGHIFHPSMRSKVRFMAEMLVDAENKAEDLIREVDGAYAFAIAKRKEIQIGRDSLGIYPLYFGEHGSICAVASERKALWKVGIPITDPFPPGEVAVVNEKGFHFKTGKTITQPPFQEQDMEIAAQRLKLVLLQSTKKRVSEVKKVAVAFSGGIDSSVLAFLAKSCSVDVHLFYVALEGQKETIFAERAARALGLRLHKRIHSVNELEDVLLKTLWLIEDATPVKSSIAVPFFWVAEESAKHGFHVLIAGQGGDELFGGYHRYLEDLAKDGPAGVERKLYKDIVSSHESNFQRDSKVCAYHKVELRMPFVDWDVIQFALSLHANLKIVSPQDRLRKRVLRHMARELGLPEFITQRPKKAIQYTTGINQSLKKLAKKESLPLHRYLERKLLEAYKTLE